MEQHPVPQQISSYQFKLVGDMTLKQFFEIAAGVVIGLIIYSLPFPAFIKWPFIIVSVLLGAAFAFLPIEERPLEQWLMAFIRSIYQPTQFFWTKSATAPQYFMAPATVKTQTDTSVAPVPTAPNATFVNNLESGEKAFFSNITRLFNVAGNSKPAAPATPQVAVQPETATVVNPNIAPPLANKWQSPQEAHPQVVITPNTPQVQKPTPVSQPLMAQQVIQQPKPVPTTIPTPVAPKKVEVPQVAPITVEKSTEPVPMAPAAPIAAPVTIKTEAINQILPNQPIQVAPQAPKPAQIAPEAAPPATPTQPNIVVGQVMDNQGKIVEGAILEIKDMQGRPVRALKSNKVGHFFIVTALVAGEYQLTAEKDGLEFDPIKIDASGQIIQPIAIKAK